MCTKLEKKILFYKWSYAIGKEIESFDYISKPNKVIVKFKNVDQLSIIFHGVIEISELYKQYNSYGLKYFTVIK